MNYITVKIYNKGRLILISMKLIFKWLLKKLLTKVTFTLDSCFFKQIDKFMMGGQGFFQALGPNTLFMFQIEFVKEQRPFLMQKREKITRESGGKARG